LRIRAALVLQRGKIGTLGIFVAHASTITVVLLSGFVSACSSSIDVPNGQYGVKTRMGEVVEVITGPAATSRQPFLEHVVVFPRRNEVDIKRPDGPPIRLSVEVTDAKKFYFLAKGDFEILAGYCERNTEHLSRQDATTLLSRQDATTLLLKKLNEPRTGIVVKMPQDGRPQAGAADFRR